jgi:hypothetical protein
MKTSKSLESHIVYIYIYVIIYIYMYIYIIYYGSFLKWGRGTLKSSPDCCRATEAFSVHQQQPQDVLKATALAVEVAQAVTWDGAQPLRRYGAGCFPQ